MLTQFCTLCGTSASEHLIRSNFLSLTGTCSSPRFLGSVRKRRALADEDLTPDGICLLMDLARQIILRVTYDLSTHHEVFDTPINQCQGHAYTGWPVH